MPVSPARTSAFDILMRVEQTDAFASELLHSSRFAKLSPSDHGLATELVMGVLRWRGTLDDDIAGLIEQPLSKLDLEVLTALRIGAYQLLFLDRIPAHAAINESVELVKRAKKRSAAGLVNAVLRKITSHSSDISQSHPSPKTGERVGQPHSPISVINASHPKWIVERWQEIYGEEATRKICEYDLSAPRAALRVQNPHPPLTARKDGAPSAVLTPIEALQLGPGKLLSHAAVVTAGDVTRSEAFRNHELVIQDEGSQLVALLVGRGKTILDCCAAPGGKTRILAEENPGAIVIAMDLHPRRAALLKKLVRAAAPGCPAEQSSAPVRDIHVIAADARAMPFAASFDRILVDSPCSGTGTLARNPEIKWRLKPEDLPRLQAYQIEILSATMNQVAPGGRIVYSTCSLEPEENQQVIEKAVASNPHFQIVNMRERLLELKEQGELTWKDIDSLLDGSYLRTIPGVHPCDGFFAAILERR